MRIVLLATVVLLLQAVAMAGEADHQHVDKTRLALRGYDPVSYFDAAPKAGRADLTAEHNGAVYRFASAANREKFVADPAKYAPAYGGWCATAMADDGSKVDIDPQNYKVTNGRLFLFYKGLLGDARKQWLKDESGQAQRADNAWKAIVEAK